MRLAKLGTFAASLGSSVVLAEFSSQASDSTGRTPQIREPFASVTTTQM